ncbi:MAG: cytochrome c oxidase assembly protein [Aromatoleum sp.]|nr:cytochrome c oxidase assembly protein [Aromatoleum sp.]
MNVALQKSNRALLMKLGFVVIAMFGFGYALVPFYEKICEVTGLRNIAQADESKSTQVDYARTVRVEFDANVRKLPWTFRPLEAIAGVHPGEVRQVMYEIVNTTDRPMTGQAIPSYAPMQAARYFSKLECFCFSRQTLQAGEKRQMPVVFVIDPALPKDIPTITLSYTFFEVEGGGADGKS